MEDKMQKWFEYVKMTQWMPWLEGEKDWLQYAWDGVEKGLRSIRIRLRIIYFYYLVETERILFYLLFLKSVFKSNMNKSKWMK